jgi:hypothetical protein
MTARARQRERTFAPGKAAADNSDKRLLALWIFPHYTATHTTTLFLGLLNFLISLKGAIFPFYPLMTSDCSLFRDSSRIRSKSSVVSG